MTERWVPAPGWPGYEVSDEGRVSSTFRMIGDRYRKILATNVGRDGYLTVQIGAVGKGRRTVLVHLLVLEAFVDPRPEGLDGCHTNDDPLDARLVNLRWDTSSANHHDAVRNGRHHNARKTHCPANHPYSLENTYRNQRGHRACRACRRS